MSGQDAVRVVQERWAEMAERLRQEDYPPLAWLAPLVDALRQHQRIGQLFPVTSHATLCLSRTTRYPFSDDCPHVDAIGHEHFRVSGPRYIMAVGTHKEFRWREAEYEVVGEGGVTEAVTWIDAALPPGCGVAIEGNRDDLRRSEGKGVTAPTTRALHTAAATGDEAGVLTLLKNGTDVNASDYDGLTALMMAVLYGKAATVRLLLRQGADIHARTSHDETALSLAIFNDKHPEIVELLKGAGAVE